MQRDVLVRGGDGDAAVVAAVSAMVSIKGTPSGGLLVLGRFMSAAGRHTENPPGNAPPNPSSGAGLTTSSHPYG